MSDQSQKENATGELRRQAEQYLMSSLLHQYYKDSLVFVRGDMEYLYDTEGKEYLDCFSGILTVNSGHCNPNINRAVANQLSQLHHTSTCYLNPPMVELAKKLSEILPGSSARKTFFVNSGSEAIDGALIMARKYTGENTIISLRHAYHGRSLLANAVTGVGSWRRVKPQLAGVHFAVNPYCYRCYFDKEYPECNLACVDALEDLMLHTCEGKVAAILIETIQGVGGYLVPPPGYFQKVDAVARKHNALLIIDEVQAGFGRTGKMFGIEHWHVEPDIIVMAKGFGNGFPIGAFSARPEIADVVEKPWLSTFGGNPISSTAALANIDYIEKNRLPENAKNVGAYCLKCLQELQKKHHLIGDVRGKGLMLALELVKDRKTKTPAAEEAVLLLEKAKDNGVLIGKAGAYDNVIRLGPPLTMSQQQIDVVINVLDRCLQEMG